MNTSLPILEPRTSALLQQAAEWRLLGLLFERPTGEWAKQVGRLATEVADEELRAAARLAVEQASPGLYDSTFGPGGPAPPREVSYRAMVDTGQFLAGLLAFYRAFAYQGPAGEPPDHVAALAGFVGYLFLKEAFAVQAGLIEQAAVTAEAKNHFIDEHLAALAEPLSRILASSGIDYLERAAATLLQRVGPPKAPAIPSPDGIHLPQIPPELAPCEESPCG